MYGYNYIRNNQNGYDISLKEMVGPNDNKIVLGVHGLNGNKETKHITEFTNIANQNGIGVVSMDLPGHGGSNINYITLKKTVSDIKCTEEYIKSKYGVDKVSALGNSFGGYLLLLDIIKNGNTFEDVVLHCPAIKMDELMYNVMLKYYEGNKENWETYMHNDDKILHVTYEIYKEMCANRIFNNFRKEDASNIHIIHGNCDQLAPLSDSIEFSSKYNSTLDIIDGANHTFDYGMDKAAVKTYEYIKKR